VLYTQWRSLEGSPGGRRLRLQRHAHQDSYTTLLDSTREVLGSAGQGSLCVLGTRVPVVCVASATYREPTSSTFRADTPLRDDDASGADHQGVASVGPGTAGQFTIFPHLREVVGRNLWLLKRPSGLRARGSTGAWLPERGDAGLSRRCRPAHHGNCSPGQHDGLAGRPRQSREIGPGGPST
jgi:hypothetical protein